MKSFKILALGDICGPRGVEYLRTNLWNKRKELQIDLVIANGENSSEPNGIDRETAQTIFNSGVDVITTGNHVWRKSSVFSYLDDEKYILRPINYPSDNPGHGSCIIDINGTKVLVINVIGEIFMDSYISPFLAIDKELSERENQYDFAVLDIHAEATSEKLSIAWNYVDDITAAFGTHTHVQTNDAQILDDKCAYITDLGMVGPTEGILGVEKESVIRKLKTKMMAKFEFETKGEIRANGAVIEIDEVSKKAISCKAITF